MHNTRHGIFGILLLATLPGVATAQAYPHKPIRFIVPFGAGGPGDAIGRMIGRPLTESLGQPVVIDNRSGATTIIGTEIAAGRTHNTIDLHDARGESKLVSETPLRPH